jgi:hypothetical protein
MLVLSACSPGQVSAPDEKGTLVHTIAASSQTTAALQVTEWRIYENAAAGRRVADGVTASGQIVVELDSSAAGFAFTGAAGRVALDARGRLIAGDLAQLSAAQQAGARLDADARRSVAAAPSGQAVMVCDTEAQALGDAIQAAVMACQMNPGSSACQTAIDGIRNAVHVLVDCILGQLGVGDGGVPIPMPPADGGASADGGAAAMCGGGDTVFVLPSCNATLSGGPAGSACMHALDCAPVCCACANGRSWLASACVAGQCADMAGACGCLSDLAPQLCP